MDAQEKAIYDLNNNEDHRNTNRPMNIWDKYPTQGTHFEAMQDKVKQHTWTYYTYYGRDRDDWSGPHDGEGIHP